MASEHQQSAKESLEIRKIRQDLLHGKISLGISTVSILTLLVGVGIERWGAYSQRDRELRLKVFEQKKEVYLALTDAASAIPACRTYAQVEEASIKFNTIYYGRAHVLAEDKPGDHRANDAREEVIKAKVALHFAIEEYLAHEKPSASPNATPSATPQEYFEQLAIDLTKACKPNMDPHNIK